jgi:hypothetical protein
VASNHTGMIQMNGFNIYRLRQNYLQYVWLTTFTAVTAIQDFVSNNESILLAPIFVYGLGLRNYSINRRLLGMMLLQTKNRPNVGIFLTSVSTFSPAKMSTTFSALFRSADVAEVALMGDSRSISTDIFSEPGSTASLFGGLVDKRLHLGGYGERDVQL